MLIFTFLIHISSEVLKFLPAHDYIATLIIFDKNLDICRRVYHLSVSVDSITLFAKIFTNFPNDLRKFLHGVLREINLLVIVAFARDRRCQTYSNFFIFNLSIGNIKVGQD